MANQIYNKLQNWEDLKHKNLQISFKRERICIVNIIKNRDGNIL